MRDGRRDEKTTGQTREQGERRERGGREEERQLSDDVYK